MLSLGDMFIQDINNVFTISKGIENETIVDVIDEKGNVYGDLVTSKYNIRPAFYIKNSLAITGGNGTIESPYSIGESNEKETEK